MSLSFHDPKPWQAPVLIRPPLQTAHIAQWHAVKALERFEEGRTFGNYLKMVAAKHGVHPDEIVGDKRLDRLFRPRVELAFRLFTERGFSKARIARLLNRNHATIIGHIEIYRKGLR